MPFTALIDYGMGNLLSVSKALASIGPEVRIVSDPEQARSAERLVLPGVGSFGDGMDHLTRSGFVPFIKEWTDADKPFLGICLGMQMLLDSSEEAPGVAGLGIIPGRVVRFPHGREKVPHIGWNSVKRNADAYDRFFPETGFDGTGGAWFYFVHSFYAAPSDPRMTAVNCEYILPFSAALSKGNLLATQFHPEKSQDNGLSLLRNFMQITQKGNEI